MSIKWFLEIGWNVRARLIVWFVFHLFFFIFHFFFFIFQFLFLHFFSFFFSFPFFFHFFSKISRRVPIWRTCQDAFISPTLCVCPVWGKGDPSDVTSKSSPQLDEEAS